MSPGDGGTGQRPTEGTVALQVAQTVALPRSMAASRSASSSAGRGAEPDHLAQFEQHHTVGDFQDGTSPLLHHQEAGSLLAEPLEHPDDVPGDERCEAKGGLVGHEELGRTHHEWRHGEHLLLAARKATGLQLAPVRGSGETLEGLGPQIGIGVRAGSGSPPR